MHRKVVTVDTTLVTLADKIKIVRIRLKTSIVLCWQCVHLYGKSNSMMAREEVAQVISYCEENKISY